MNREELIKKWLDHNLNSEEQLAFEALEDYEDLQKLSDATKAFKSPNFDSEEAYLKVKSLLNKSKDKNWLRPLLKIAAVLILALSLFYYNSTLDTEIETQIAEETSINLPDASNVALNSQSTIIYNKKTWSDKREVVLDGEAYFKVAKGSKFDVITNDGKVSVLGTQFNVIQHKNYFEVTCYEGLVAVSYKDKSVKLEPGYRFAVIDGVIKNETVNTLQPSWLNNESTFNSRPLKYILAEFERHYNVSLQTDTIDLNQLYTGSFTHNNIDTALQSITIPLGITYIKSDSVIVLKSE